MVSHIVGGAFGIAALATCVVRAFIHGGAYEVVSAFIYGFSMILLYTMSSVYHGLKPEDAKKVMQVIDHCTVFILIAGTYTPVALCSLRRASTALGWTVLLGKAYTAICIRYSIFLWWRAVFCSISALFFMCCNSAQIRTLSRL